MGNYNPHVPQILGEEWVPIRDEDVTFSPAVNALELGHSFTLATVRQVRDARFYLHNPPENSVVGQFMMAAIYPAGAQDQSGPIRSIVIPCNAGAVTGATLSNASTVAEALFDPSDLRGITFTTNNDRASCFFDVSTAPILNGKRILGVNVLYNANVPDISDENLRIFIESDAGAGLTAWTSTEEGDGVLRLRLGEVNHFWSTTLSPGSTPDRMPWRYNDLLRFRISSASRICIMFRNNGVGIVTATVGYAALEVVFCEESRVAYGACAFSPDYTFIPNAAKNYVLGANSIPLRDLNFNPDPILPVGDYALVISSPDTGDLQYPTAGNITTASIRQAPAFLNGTREYYAIPSHPYVQVDLPFPPEERIGSTFEESQTHVIPQLSLHASGGTLTEPHVYGRQAVAQIYGTITATQDILDSAVGTAKSWPQVRYYARRFGDTTVPLLLDSPTITGSGLSVQISPQDFDELDEILDGWKEVTLRFSTAPTMGAGTTPQWRWSANGELPGNRWEILGCTAPALSGVPGNLYNLVPSPNQLSGATYGAPNSGATVNLAWIPQYAPTVTAVSDDQTSDGVLIFAQDMLPVTGFSLIESSQAVSGIGPDCGLDPCCIPTEIFYNAISWSKPINTGIGSDGFARSVAAGSWGTADVGGAYTLSGTAADFSVGTSLPPWDTTAHGLITFSAVNSARFAVLNVGAIDFDVTVDISPLSTPDGGGLIRGGPVGRYTDANNNYYASADIASTGVVQLRLEKRVGGVITQIALTNRPDLSGGIGAALTIRIIGYGTFLKAKIWKAEDPEPTMWDIETTDTSLTTGNFAGVFGRDGSTSTGHTMSYDNLIITPPQYWFGYYELQRMDDLTDWQSIMKATNPAQITFADYEARVGVLSSYRIRAVDVYGFAGPWSSTITSTLTEPGLEIECDGGHVLLFTSNSRQDGSINLAYSSVWDGNASVSEDFEFPEVGDVQLQKMYNKDFVTAFRPLERGGERFTRTVLVQAAAISPPTLGDFTALRDMAWDTVPYICVRDEDGNRWFATVLVPAGRVQLNRTIYMASVTIVQVTDTAYPVDP